MDKRTIDRLNAWRIWSSDRLLEGARGLRPEQLAQRFEIGRGTLLATLEHMQWVEELWLARLVGDAESCPGDRATLGDLGAITSAWALSHAAWTEYLASLEEADFDRQVRGVNSKGEPFAMPVLDCVLHVHTHAAYTAAQACNIFRRLGVGPPDVSLATLSRQEHPVVVAR